MSNKINWVKMGLYGCGKIQTTYEPLRPWCYNSAHKTLDFQNII